MTTLRSKLIRLAHEQPHLRSRILPLLSGRVAKSEFEEQFDKANKLDAVDPTVAKLIVESGQDDGSPSDDKVSVSKTSINAESLKPSQTTMVLGKALQMALLMLKTGKVGGDLEALISKDNHILDGHHRWAATILAGGGNVGGYKADLDGPDLLRVLNIISKGAFGVRSGKPGKGSISEFTKANVKKTLEDYVENGYGGDYPSSADAVRKILEDAFGSAEKGIEEISKNVENMDKSVPSWAPDRKQMPVIDPDVPGQVQEAAKLLNSGDVDWHAPYKQASLRSKLIRFPEGIMSEEEWVRDHADRVEEAKVDWHNLIDRKKFNRLEGRAQEDYEAQLKKKAEKPEYRAWKGDTFYTISKETYTKAKGMGKTAADKQASLRSKLIRLAHAKPALRSHILPLLR